MSRDDIPTIIVCLACGGEYEHVQESPDGKYRATRCRWCIQGGMDRVQAIAWAKYQRERRESGEYQALDPGKKPDR